MTMKNTFATNNSNDAAAAVERKKPAGRPGTKTFTHRYERRKIREQLRHLDWALVGAD